MNLISSVVISCLITISDVSGVHIFTIFKFKNYNIHALLFLEARK